MRLHLGERDDPIDPLQRRRQGQVRQGRPPEPVGHQHDVVVIQVDELEPRLRQDGPQPRLLQDELGIAAVARALGRRPPGRRPSRGRPRPRARTTAGCVLTCGASEHGSTRFGFSKIDLPRTALGPDAQLAQPRAEDRLQVGSVRRGPGDHDRGAQETLARASRRQAGPASPSPSAHGPPDPRQERSDCVSSTRPLRGCGRASVAPVSPTGRQQRGGSGRRSRPAAPYNDRRPPPARTRPRADRRGGPSVRGRPSRAEAAARISGSVAAEVVQRGATAGPIARAASGQGQQRDAGRARAGGGGPGRRRRCSRSSSRRPGWPGRG